MGNKEALQLFGEKRIRTAWNQEEEKWYFSIVDVCAALTDSVDATAYWRKLKERLRKEGNETVTNCHAFKMRAADGKMRQTDVADQQQLFRLIQSIPSPKAEWRIRSKMTRSVRTKLTHPYSSFHQNQKCRLRRQKPLKPAFYLGFSFQDRRVTFHRTGGSLS